jgi:ribosomal-protein-alanine N-acetyltransferase
MHKLNFNPFPSLTTSHYILRPLHHTDAQAVYILRTDEDVNRYLDRQKARSIDDVFAFIQNINESIAKDESILWVICTPSDTALMGTICLWNIDVEKSKAEIGYELLPAFQGKGIFREVMPAVISFAFKNMGLQTIEACVSQSNSNSIKLLEINGFASNGQVDADQMTCYTLTVNK